DGPTHQPVEQLASLRAIPDLTVIRPADANETAAAWRVAVRRPGPTALALTRQGLPVLEGAGAAREGVSHGAYVVAESQSGEPDVILIGSGSEVSLALEARRALEGDGIRTRVVSMPSFELFREQPAEYQDAILPPKVRARVTVEAGVTQGWDRYAGDLGESVGLDRFGASAPAKVVFAELGLTPESVVAAARRSLARAMAAGRGPDSGSAPGTART
ncbi:MAG: transketolase C-terminal domain-containing protein, partial [Dehalococcoidia bacterium]